MKGNAPSAFPTHPASERARVAFLLRAIALLALLATSPSRAQSRDSLLLPPAPPTPTVRLPRVGGYIQVRQVAQEQVGLTALLNRVRLLVDGTLPARFSYRALLEMQSPAGVRLPATVSLREAIIRWSPAPFGITAGEFKTPFTREYLIPVPALEVADLAVVVDSLAPKYDVGLMADCTLGEMFGAAIGVFNGEGANSIANRDSTVLLVGRVVSRPIPQLGLGASATRDGADSLRWGVDAVVQQHGLLVRAEYVTRHVRGRDRADDDFGWYLFEGLRLMTRVQLVARQEDFQRPARGVANRIRGSVYGTNFEIVPGRVRLLLQYSRRTSGPRQTRTDSILGQLQAQF
jgi:hypothetical protein